ncbi:MAG: ATPase [Eubacteriales bacterium]|nr:ATPase [Eubacteriales bacterium]
MIDSSRADYAQNQDIESLLERLESLVISARSVPFSDNCMVDREEMLVLITMIRDELPGELKQAKWLLEQNRQLIAEARKEAEAIMRDAEARMSRMIDEHEITQKARLQAADLLEKSNQAAQKIRSGSMDYARKRLSEIEEQLGTMLAMVQRNKKDLM